MKNEAVSNRNVIQRARFGADGSMAWEAEEGSGAYVTRKGDEWKYVRRCGMMGGTTTPGSCLQARDPQPPSPSRDPQPPLPSPYPSHSRSYQFRHVMPRAGYEELGELANAPVAYTLPAMRVYRVPRGWVLRSSHDTFTSFARDMATFVPQRTERASLEEEEEEDEDDKEYGGPPKFTWCLWALRKQVDKLDKRHTDSIDRDWLDFEQVRAPRCLHRSPSTCHHFARLFARRRKTSAKTSAASSTAPASVSPATSSATGWAPSSVLAPDSLSR